MNEENVSIEDVIMALKKRIKFIIIVPLVAVILAGIVMNLTAKVKYQSSAKIFVGNSVTNTDGAKFDYSSVEMYQKLMKTYIEIAANPDLIKQSIEDRGLDVDPAEVVSGITIDQIVDTQVLQISYESSNRILTPIVLDTIVENFTKKASEFIPNGSLQVMESVKEEPAVIMTNVKKNVIMVGLIFFLISTGIALLLGYMDNSIKKKEELENITKLPVLGVIPVEK